LSVCHSIVCQHGGSVIVRTAREGTTFTVRLPSTTSDSGDEP
jgi:signal transduction histidine kinase